MNYKCRKIQVVRYKCCGVIFAACVEPHCYTDEEWLENLKKYVNRGYTVEMIDAGKGNLRFDECKCKENLKQ